VTHLFTPTLSAQQTRKNLTRLMVFGSIRDPALERDVIRLRERFLVYSACYPYGLWDEGLAVTGEMRAVTELYLPMAEIARALKRLLSLSFRYFPEPGISLLAASTSWLGFLRRHREASPVVNPGRLLKMLAADESYRIRFLFAFLLPRRHGESFYRYPAQIRFLDSWIHQRRGTLLREVRCLDAACGTGESTYDLAILLQARGICAQQRSIHGCSLEPLELFAAAHGFFPHDPAREKIFRMRTEPLIERGEAGGIVFFQDDVSRPPRPGERPYDIILCNGLLGGPFIHDERKIESAVTSLALRLKPGGILLAADRFHGGWKKEAPPGNLKEALYRSGFTLHPIEDGIAAERE
jgi:chemotaxis methyl-accepting protein methylase